MTNEEAIKWIKYHIGISDYEETDELLKAFELAIKALEQEPCEDAISRQAVLEQIYLWRNDEFLRVTNPFDYLNKRINSLSLVTPQPKIGRWIESKGYDDRDHFYSCSECGRSINLICGATLADYPYCHCGAKMQQEVEK